MKKGHNTIEYFLGEMGKVRLTSIFIIVNFLTILSLAQLSLASPSQSVSLSEDSPPSIISTKESVENVNIVKRRNSRTRTGRQDEEDDSEQEQAKVTAAAAVPAASGNATKVEEILEPVTIGRFRPFVHAIDSSDVIIIDEKTLEIPDFSYDGEGPASWFVVGKDGEYTREMVDLGEYTVIPDEDESCNSLRRYNQQTIKLTLPGKLTVYDIEYLSVYCLRFNHNFGYVVIPDDIKVPKAGKKTAKVDECEDVEPGEGGGSGGRPAGGSAPVRRPPPPREPASRPGLLGGLLNILG